MVQIKLSIAFVLAAAAIAPVVAQPIREGNEFASNPHLHRHHHHHHHHHHQRVATPERSSLEPTSDTIPAPSRREYADEFEVRDLLDDSKPEFVAREFDDLFERQDSEGAESSGSTSPHPLRFGPGPVRLPNGGAFPPHRVRLGHGVPLVHRPFKGFPPHRLRLGHGLLGHRPFRGLSSRRPGSGIGPALLRHGPARRRVGPREYAESDELFERDFKDFEEFDARDFDDELYLD